MIAGLKTEKMGHVIIRLGYNIVYLCAKFDHSSFSRSGDMVGAHHHQNLSGLRDMTTTLPG